MAYSSVSILLFLTTTALTSCYGNNLGLDFHHRFSDNVREWTDSHGFPPTWKTEEAPRGSVEYYQKLLKYDLHRHRGRSLADGDLYAFAGGNDTVQYLGQLHYAFVYLGTPNQTFLVALDTGSHLFWVPCNCKQCAPTSDPSYGNIVFRNYEPSASTTSKKISCSSNQCFPTFRSQCTNQSPDCTYTIRYGDGNTSSSGTLMQDDLYLIKQDVTSELVKLSIVFGCGEVQTGDLLEGKPPNGLMGLGLTNISVATMIANSGLISDSFSMCFGLDGYGRLNFGDKGSADQYETKLNIDPKDFLSPFYNISLTEVGVGRTVSNLSFTAIVDSGTSFSRFTDDVYTKLVTSFSAQVSEQQIQVEGLPFEYCFEISANQTIVRVPPVYFTTKGGSRFQALHPAVLLFEQNSEKPFAYCLAVLRSGFNIIGENFLIGQRIVFDREKQVFGWKPYNCSGYEVTDTAAPAPVLSTSDPSTAAPSPAISVPSRAWAHPVGRSTVISVVTSLISINLVWLLF